MANLWSVYDEHNLLRRIIAAGVQVTHSMTTSTANDIAGTGLVEGCRCLRNLSLKFYGLQWRWVRRSARDH